MMWAQQDLAGRDEVNFRLNFLRLEAVGNYNQQPLYDWAATYIGNPFDIGQSSSGYVLDSSTCGYGIPNTLQFGQEIKAYYSYANDQVTEVLFKSEESAGAYTNFSRKLYAYTNGLQTGYLYQLWNPTNAMWEDDYEEERMYDTDGNLTGFQLREMSNGQWQNLFRETKVYDTAGHIIEILSARWTNGAWEDTAMTTIAYNDLGAYSRIVELEWNGSAWDSLTRETATYGQLGLIWDTYLMEEKTPTGWQGFVREQYDYDTYGFWTDMRRQGWDAFSSSWVDLVREQFNYSRKGIWNGWNQQLWDGTDWENYARQQHNLADSIREDRLEFWDASAGSWNNDARAIAQYDNGLLQMQASIQSWDMAGSDWTNTANTRQCTHAWSQRTSTSISSTRPQLDCTMTNPYRVYEPIHCESLQSGKHYDLRLIDMQGRTVYQQSVQGGQQFSIDRSLPTGVYSLSIAEDRQMRFLRKIIVQ